MTPGKRRKVKLQKLLKFLKLATETKMSVPDPIKKMKWEFR